MIRFKQFFLEAQQNKSLTVYSGSKYKEINAGLRRGKILKQFEKVITEIDSLMKPAGKELVLYRAAAIPEINAALENKEDITGLTYVDKAFVSASTNKKMLDIFSSSHVQGDKVARSLILHVSPEVEIVDMKGSSQFGEKEGEILINRGMKFKVMEVENTKEKEKYVSYFPEKKNLVRTVKKQYIHVKVTK